MVRTLNSLRRVAQALGVLLCLAFPAVHGAPAVRLFEDDFNRGIPGWFAVQPPGNYIEGPMRWQYDIVSGSFVEQSNIYTDSSAASPSATAVMLINEAVTGTNFVYRARLLAGDDDGFGLIFGYRDPQNFYRVTFTRQIRTEPGFPWTGWNVDRKVDGVATNLFGSGAPGHVDSFINVFGQPFDVTIRVEGNNLFSLTVIDDPEGFQIEYPLVQSQPLPDPADGQVGLMSWGMSGTAIRGFRIQNPTLEPGGLVGNPNALEQWTPVILPRADGSELDPGSGNGGQPLWSLALGQNGAFGTLHENSDAYGGNDGTGFIDFATGAVVAGDTNWTNYIMSVRIIPADDDAYGALVRYRDERNHYRVTLRTQASSTGPLPGLSIQKVVDGFPEEVFHDDPVTFSPTIGQPLDLSVIVVDDTLQVVIVADPNGAAQAYSYGPFQISGSTIPSGRIGLFSWGMSRVEFDNVTVDGIDGVPFQVLSAYGDPTPARGLHGFPAGSTVEASVVSPVQEGPDLRRIVAGWTGFGSVPASGTGNSVNFQISEFSTIQWHWDTEVRLVASATEGGTVSGPGDEWLPEGAEVTLVAQPDPNHVFMGWAGDFLTTQPSLSLLLTRPVTVEARFAPDSDGDGLPDPWEQTHFGGLAAGPNDDPDGDGASNRVEYDRGSDPNHAETLAATLTPESPWEIVQRDPGLPGQFMVHDFGDGFRGVWDNSNDYRQAVPDNWIGEELSVPLVSFEGPRMILRTNVWNPAWTDFTASAIFSVGDNDGNCVYFRYVDENNWYRVTITGENNNADWRAPFGVSVQKRVDGVFSELAQDASIATDPLDTSFFKRVRVAVTAQGSNFEIRVTGWNAYVAPPDWDPWSELVFQVSDSDHPSGRFGVGTWGQGSFGSATATENNPISSGVLIEDVVVTVNGNEVFVEDWEATPLSVELPDGWTNPFTAGPVGDWRVSAHGTFAQLSDVAPATTATANIPRGDADTSMILAPSLGLTNFLLTLRVHPFDDDGVGFIYDFKDTDNYSRAIFVNQASAAGRIPRGLTVSRKSNGVWTDLFAGDASFIYTNGSPFDVEFSSVNGSFRLTARHADAPSESVTWAWTGPATSPSGRIGFTTWGGLDSHFADARVYEVAGGEGGGEPGDAPAIEAVAVNGGNLVLSISNPGGAPYDVEASESLAGASWTVVAANQTGEQWSVALDASKTAVFYRLVRR